MPPGTLLQQIRDAIVSSYEDEDDLNESLRILLNMKLAHATKPAKFPSRVFKLIEWFENRGQVADLVLALSRDRPQKQEMQNVLLNYGMAVPVGVQLGGVAVPTAPSSAADAGFEKIVRPRLKTVDFGVWRKKMTRVEAQVCHITFPYRGKEEHGTGFLVGPDAVLTNFHVIEKVFKKQVPPTAVECRFDYKRLADGTAPYTPVKLAADWYIDHSQYNAGEQNGTPDTPPLPTIDELDYALIRLAEPVGSEPWAKSGTGEAPTRGWVWIPDMAPALADQMAVMIAQHPEGDPMQLAVDTEAIQKGTEFWLNEAGTRVRYATTTLGGSSGSPVFDFDWNLIALHHYGDPKNKFATNLNLRKMGDWNQGVPISLIRDRLTRRGKAGALGGPS